MYENILVGKSFFFFFFKCVNIKTSQKPDVQLKSDLLSENCVKKKACLCFPVQTKKLIFRPVLSLTALV